MDAGTAERSCIQLAMTGAIPITAEGVSIASLYTLSSLMPCRFAD